MREIMRTAQNITLGALSLLIFNENFEALWLNAVGIASFALLTWLNRTSDGQEILEDKAQ